MEHKDKAESQGAIIGRMISISNNRDERRLKYTVYSIFIEWYYKCIGASDKIFVHFNFLSSIPTTPLGFVSLYSRIAVEDSPFNLVPIGSPPLLIKTHALSSNFTTLPSGRCHFFLVLTTTACRISPRRTLFAAEVPTLAPGPDSEKFLCFWTTTIMRSPMSDQCLKVRSI